MGLILDETTMIVQLVLKPVSRYIFLYAVKRLPLNKNENFLLVLRAGADYNKILRIFTKKRKAKVAQLWLFVASGDLLKWVREILRIDKRAVDWKCYKDKLWLWFCESFSQWSRLSQFCLHEFWYLGSWRLPFIFNTRSATITVFSNVFIEKLQKGFNFRLSRLQILNLCSNSQKTLQQLQFETTIWVWK